MMAALILLAAITGVGAILYLHHRYSTSRPSSNPEVEPEPESRSQCCGMHITCEKDSLVAGIDTDILYYDDEELDEFAGRQPREYTEAEMEMFREVLYTLKPDEIAPWARSIATRGITLPTAVRDELLMIVAEARAARDSGTAATGSPTINNP